MYSLMTFESGPVRCSYLPDERANLEYEMVAELSAPEYLERMVAGWRRFGHDLFHPVCPRCRACQPLRIRVAGFRPDRSQRRCRKINEPDIELRIGEPQVTRAKLTLYDRFHSFQGEHRDWTVHGPKDPHSYAESFVHHPFPTEEWCYYLGNRLVGVGYVDHLPLAPPTLAGHGAEGMSAIYFFHEPDERHRGLGTWNVLSILDEARRRGLPHVYLGYYVAGCTSMEYKARFVPNEVRHPDGTWQTFRT